MTNVKKQFSGGVWVLMKIMKAMVRMTVPLPEHPPHPILSCTYKQSTRQIKSW